MAGIRINLPIDKINLFKENPRFEPVASQKEAIFAILNNQGDKLFELAKDIKEHGLNPGDSPYIIADEVDKGFYIVLEGNRRFSCIKLLENPELIKDYPDGKAYLKFKKLSEEYSTSINRIITVECVLFDSFLEAAPWIERKHVGEVGGKGTVTWVSLQSNRFKRLLTGKASVELQVADFVRSHFPDIAKNIEKLPITNLERLLGDKYVKSQLGLEVKEGVVYANIELKEVTKSLGKIVLDLIEGNIDVNDIYHSEDRKKYIDGLDAEYKPNLKKTLKTQVKLDPVSTIVPSTSTKKKKTKSPLDRSTVISSVEAIKSKHTKIDQLIYELKTISADKCPIAAAFLLRSLLEFSIQEYLDRNTVTAPNDKLHVRVTSAITHLKSKTLVTKDQIKGIEAWINDPASWCSINSLNAVVHNSTFTIPLSTLISGFENIKPFLIVVWAN
ncbi:hypothetical protein ACFGVR_06185 [Mucilaginibacter sp. AW1-3]